MSDFTGPVTTTYDPALTPQENVDKALSLGKKTVVDNKSSLTIKKMSDGSCCFVVVQKQINEPNSSVVIVTLPPQEFDCLVREFAGSFNYFAWQEP